MESISTRSSGPAADELARRLQPGAARHRDVEHGEVDVLAQAAARRPRCRPRPRRRPRGRAPRRAPSAARAARPCGRRRAGSRVRSGTVIAAAPRGGPRCRPARAGRTSSRPPTSSARSRMPPSPTPWPAASASRMPRPSSRTRSTTPPSPRSRVRSALPRLRMAGDVGEALLRDAVDREVLLGRQRRELGREPGAHAHARCAR